MEAKLSIVATPIGNLKDISERALGTLRTCDVVLCEDTRVTKKLLSHYNIQKPVLSYHLHSGITKDDKVFSLLQEGKHLALVSDAGTPTISDPGAILVREVRRDFGSGVTIETIPGPSAVTAALSICGISADSYMFLGFPPHKKGRKTFFDKLARREETVVFFESPHRFMKALEALKDRLDKNRTVAVCRELTKFHEEVQTGSIEDVFGYYLKHPEIVRGEFVVIVDAKKNH